MAQEMKHDPRYFCIHISYQYNKEAKFTVDKTWTFYTFKQKLYEKFWNNSLNETEKVKIMKYFYIDDGGWNSWGCSGHCKVISLSLFIYTVYTFYLI